MPSRSNLPFVNYLEFDVLDKTIPLYALYKYKVLNRCLTSNEETAQAKFGYNKRDDKWDTVANPISSSGKSIFIKSSLETSTALMLDSLNKLCAENNAKLLCIQTPMYKSVWDNAAFERNRRICSTANVPYIDVNTTTIGEHVENFYNTFHMNTNGVRKMNAFLAADSTLKVFLN
jgi:hypothetical protein